MNELNGGAGSQHKIYFHQFNKYTHTLKSMILVNICECIKIKGKKMKYENQINRKIHSSEFLYWLYYKAYHFNCTFDEQEKKRWKITIRYGINVYTCSRLNIYAYVSIGKLKLKQIQNMIKKNFPFYALCTNEHVHIKYTLNMDL